MAQLEQLEQVLSELATKEAQLVRQLQQQHQQVNPQQQEQQQQQASLQQPQQQQQQPTRTSEQPFEIVEPEPQTRHSPYQCRHMLLVLKDLSLLPGSIQWLKQNGPACYATSSHLTIAFPSAEPVKASRQDAVNNPQLKEILSSVPNSSVCLFGFSPIQMTRGCVTLCQQPAPETGRVADVVAIAGCEALNRREFEAPDYVPLLEEILLKEAIQPVIMMK